MKVTAETVTDEQIDELRRASLAPHGYVGDTYYWAQLSKQTIPGVRDPARAWLAAAWNARHSDGDE